MADKIVNFLSAILLVFLLFVYAIYELFSGKSDVPVSEKVYGLCLTVLPFLVAASGVWASLYLIANVGWAEAVLVLLATIVAVLAATGTVFQRMYK